LHADEGHAEKDGKRQSDDTEKAEGGSFDRTNKHGFFLSGEVLAGISSYAQRVRFMPLLTSGVYFGIMLP
jgi:hypothetical protein